MADCQEDNRDADRPKRDPTTYNRAEMLRDALQSLLQLETDGRFACEVVVVDNDSTDYTAPIVSDLAASSRRPLRYVVERTKGIPAVRNRRPRGCVPLNRLLRRRSGRRSPVACRTRGPGRAAGCLLRRRSAVCGRRLMQLNSDDMAMLSATTQAVLGKIDVSEEPCTVGLKGPMTTGTLLIHRSVFDEVGEFDLRLNRGGSDTDLHRRIHAAGIPVWYAPRSLCLHAVPLHRLRADCLAWCSMRVGDDFAHRDNSDWPLPRLLATCGAHLGQARLVHGHQLLWASMVGDRRAAQGLKCRHWRAWGYARTCLHVLSSKAFSQRRFFRRLDYRVERQLAKAKAAESAQAVISSADSPTAQSDHDVHAGGGRR